MEESWLSVLKVGGRLKYILKGKEKGNFFKKAYKRRRDVN